MSSQQINLYNPAFIPPREWITARSLALATAAVLVVVIISGVAAHTLAGMREATLTKAQAERLQAQQMLDAAKAAADARKPSAALQAEVALARARLALRNRILDATQLNLAEPGGGFSRYLTGLARHSVPGLWLNQVGIDATGANLSLGGQTVRQEAVADYVRRLKTEPIFAGKSFAGLDMLMATAAPGAGPGGPVSPAAVSPALTSAPVAAQTIQFHLLATRSTEKDGGRQ